MVGLTDALLRQHEHLKIFFEMCKVFVFLPSQHFAGGLSVLREYAKTPGTNTIIEPARKLLAYMRRRWLPREYLHQRKCIIIFMRAISFKKILNVVNLIYNLIGSSIASVFRAPKRTNNEIEAYHRWEFSNIFN